jgi:hypothetical protein
MRKEAHVKEDSGKTGTFGNEINEGQMKTESINNGTQTELKVYRGTSMELRLSHEEKEQKS